MSFIRFTEEGSDVYVYPSEGLGGTDLFTCCACRLGDQWDFATKGAMRLHLRAHEVAGHCVPKTAFDELEAWDPND